MIVANKISENIKIKTLYSIILFFLTFDQLLINGYQDYILFSFIIIIFNFLDKINLKKIDYYQCVFIILSSYILAWLKNEGFFYFLFINIFLCYFLSFKKKIFLISIVFLLIFIKLSLFNKIDENFDLLKIIFSNNLNLTNFSLIELINKVYFITLHILISFFKYRLWLLFFISFFLKKLKKNEIYILYFGIVSILFIFGPFLISKSDLYWHVTGALDRISIQLLGFFIIFIAYRIKYFNKKFLGMK